jgi:hypothetical protein
LLFAVATSAQSQGIGGAFTSFGVPGAGTRSSLDPWFGAKPSFIVFDVPGAGRGTLQGTIPISINAAGDITRIYFDAINFPLAHGFLRAADGTITEFDVPGAGTAGTSFLFGTAGSSVNDSGDITGVYADANGVFHGFVVTPAHLACPADHRCPPPPSHPIPGQ